VPEPVYAGYDTDVPVTFETVEEGTEAYGDVRYVFATSPSRQPTMNSSSTPSPTAAPGLRMDLSICLSFTRRQSTGRETIDWTLSFSEVGEYTITFSFRVEVEGLDAGHFSRVVSVIQMPLYGDATGDGVVNLLDLVFVRNRLFADVEEGDNRQADINDDDFVDLEDLIEVRNNLGATR